MTACPLCGLTVAEGDIYCQYCGEKLTLSSTQTPPSSTAVGIAAPAAPGPAQLASPTKKRGGRRKKQAQAEKRSVATICPSCGLPVPPTAFFCPHCNAPVVEGSRSAVQPKSPSIQKVPKETPSDIAGKINFWLSTRNDRTVRNLLLIIVSLVVLLMIALLFVYF